MSFDYVVALWLARRQDRAGSLVNKGLGDALFCALVEPPTVRQSDKIKPCPL